MNHLGRLQPYPFMLEFVRLGKVIMIRRGQFTLCFQYPQNSCPCLTFKVLDFLGKKTFFFRSCFHIYFVSVSCQSYKYVFSSSQIPQKIS